MNTTLTTTPPTNLFDVEQGIMNCWHITDDLNVLLEELVENDAFTKDQASNFVLGLTTIYESKFDKLFRTFEDFVKNFYAIKNELQRTHQELQKACEEMTRLEEANAELSAAVGEPEIVTLDILFLEEEMRNLEEERASYDDEYVEDEYSRF